MNHDGVIDQHRVAARALWLLRERYIHLIADLKAGVLSFKAARIERRADAGRCADLRAGAGDRRARMPTPSARYSRMRS